MENLENLRSQIESIKKLQTEPFGLNGESTSTLFDSLGIDFDVLNRMFTLINPALIIFKTSISSRDSGISV